MIDRPHRRVRRLVETGFFSVDFKGGELVTFAVSARRRVGRSRLGEALNLGLDAHAALGAQMLGWSYERMVAALNDPSNPDHKLAKAIRQCAKWGNFGFLGGMKPVKFVLTQRRQGDDTPHPLGPSRVWNGSDFVPGWKGFRLCIPVLGTKSCGAVKVTSWNDRPCTPTCRDCIVAAEKIYNAFMIAWPEAGPYLKWHSQNAEQVGEVVQHGSKRIRGGLTYNSEANGDFQALLADIAKEAHQRVSFLQYVDRSSVLYGSRTIAFLHDELLGEAPLDVLPAVATEIRHQMRQTFREWCPEYADACDAEEAISVRWAKGMSPVRDAAGNLLLWAPKPWRLDPPGNAPALASVS